MNSLLKKKSIVFYSSQDFGGEYVVPVVAFDSRSGNSFLLEMGLGTSSPGIACERAALVACCSIKVEELSDFGIRFLFASSLKKAPSLPPFQTRGWTSISDYTEVLTEGEQVVRMSHSRVSRLFDEERDLKGMRELPAVYFRVNPGGGLKIRLTVGRGGLFTRRRVQLGLRTKDVEEGVARMSLLYTFLYLTGFCPAEKALCRFERNEREGLAARTLELRCILDKESRERLVCPERVCSFTKGKGAGK